MARRPIVAVFGGGGPKAPTEAAHPLAAAAAVKDLVQVDPAPAAPTARGVGGRRGQAFDLTRHRLFGVRSAT